MSPGVQTKSFLLKLFIPCGFSVIDVMGSIAEYRRTPLLNFQGESEVLLLPNYDGKQLVFKLRRVISGKDTTNPDVAAAQEDYKRDTWEHGGVAYSRLYDRFDLVEVDVAYE